MMRETRLRFFVFAALVLQFASARGALAQTIAGTIRDGLKQTPIAGAIVQLVDARDSVLAATRSAGDGSFRLADVSTQDSTRRLRLQRLGFRPATVPFAARLASGAELYMTALPVELGAIVTTPRTCRNDADDARARAIWTDARAAWLAGIGSTDGDKPTTLVREALMNGGWRWPTIPPIRSGSAAQSFEVSRAALERYLLEHARRGATSAVDSSSSGGGPLRDPGFAAAHCMRVERGRDAHRGELAIVFEPVRRNERPIEMAGTLWLDTNAALPRALSFEYLTPTVRDRKRAGATVTFSATRDGLPTVARWVMHLLPAHEPHPARNVRIILPAMWITAMRDTVGDSVLVRWDSTTSTLGAPPHLVGRVTRLGTDEPLGGVRVAISPATRLTADGQVAKSRSIVTDSLGQFDLEIPILTLQLRAIDTTFEAVRSPSLDPPPDFDWDITTIREGERDGPPHGAFRAQSIPFDHDQHATISVEKNEDAFRNACGLKRSRPDRWMIAGRVLPSPAAEDPPTQAVVRARWLERSGENGRAREEVRDQATDSLGYFAVCKLPAGEPVSVSVGGVEEETTVRAPAGASIVPLLLRQSATIRKH